MKPLFEKPSPIASAEPVACEIVRGKDFGCVLHYHPECEITLVLKGGTTRLIGDQLTPLLPGDLVFLGPNVPHDFRNEPVPGKPTAQVAAIVVQFLPNLPGMEEWQHRSSMQPTRRLFERANQGLEVTGITRLTASRMMKQMGELQGMKRVIHLLQLIDLLANSEEVHEICTSVVQQPKATSPDRIGKVCVYLEAHLTEPLYVADLAAMIGLGRSAFSRLFKSSTSRTVPQYINDLRIAHASKLLAETDLTVSQIAYDCGFVSPAHFQRQFRGHQACAPLAYRQKMSLSC
ncbi:MAG: AraC family transcriptional regulator [Prosthecobacter sp.]